MGRTKIDEREDSGGELPQFRQNEHYFKERGKEFQ